MSFQPRMIFTLGVMVVAAYAVYASRDWSLGTGLFPWFVGIPVLVLAVIQMILDIYQSFRPAKAAHTDTGDLQVDMSMGMGVVARRASVYFGWLFGLFFGIIIFGFFISIPLFTLLYLKYQAKEGWLLSSGLTLGTFVFFVGLFHKILHVHWPKPLLRLPETILKTLLPWLN